MSDCAAEVARRVDGLDDSGRDDAAADVRQDAGEGNAWWQQTYVKAPNTEGSDNFGSSVALSDDGSILAVGAAKEAGGSSGIGGDQADNAAPGAGAVYLY